MNFFFLICEGVYDVERHFQQYFSYIVGGQFCWWRKPEYLENITDLPQVIDKDCQ
jgi:hypothetical protein